VQEPALQTEPLDARCSAGCRPVLPRELFLPAVNAVPGPGPWQRQPRALGRACPRLQPGLSSLLARSAWV